MIGNELTMCVSNLKWHFKHIYLAPHDDECGTIVIRPLKRVIFMFGFDFPLLFKSLTQHPIKLNNIERFKLSPLRQRHPGF